MKHYKKRNMQGMWRRIKKRRNGIPSQVCIDPFLKIPVYINAKGKTIGYYKGRWQVVWKGAM